jgi:hypothetical protein
LLDILLSPSIVLGRKSLTLDFDAIYRQMAAFINIEIAILTPITFSPDSQVAE